MPSSQSSASTKALAVAGVVFTIGWLSSARQRSGGGVTESIAIFTGQFQQNNLMDITNAWKRAGGGQLGIEAKK